VVLLSIKPNTSPNYYDMYVNSSSKHIGKIVIVFVSFQFNSIQKLYLCVS